MASTLFLAFALLLCSLRQAGAQSFVRPANNPAAAGLSPNEGATGDFNNDGYPDMIVASATTGIVGILVNDGTGTLVRLATNIATLPMPRAVSVADFDLDGNLDFVIQARGNLSHYVYLGAGDGTFKQGSIVGNRLHQYSIGGNARISGITESIFALVPLQPGAYQAVMRACWNGTACTATSEFGWGPWNNAPGSTGGIASFTVR